MSYREKLQAWQREQGEDLVDVKFFPGESRDQSIEQLAEGVYRILTKDCETVDVTDEIE